MRKRKSTWHVVRITAAQRDAQVKRERAAWLAQMQKLASSSSPCMQMLAEVAMAQETASCPTTPSPF